MTTLPSASPSSSIVTAILRSEVEASRASCAALEAALRESRTQHDSDVGALRQAVEASRVRGEEARAAAEAARLP